MKKIKLFVALSALCTGMQAQFTGLNTYQHTVPGTNLRLTDGTTTTFNSKGFILTGHVPTAAGTPNIYIDKTDEDGMFNLAPGEFQMEYKFAADPVKPCGANIVPAINCYGASLAELKFPSAPEWYVMAATFENGCLYSGLDMNGNVVCPAYYTFPVFATNKTKPIIKTSAFNPGRFYICGSYLLNGKSHLYVMKIGTCGAIGWSRDYTFLNGATEFVPADMVESPYIAPSGIQEIKIVGTCDDGGANLREGFLLSLDANSGAPGFIPSISFGSGFMSGTNERFFSIAIANSGAAGGPGFLIGGSTDVNTTLGTSWMLKVNPIGNILWSSQVLATIPTGGEITAVVERKNTIGSFDCFGAATENNGMTVFKLDDTGNMFTAWPNNEFIYNDNIGGNGVPVAISYLDASFPNQEGVHVYGMNTPGTGDYFLTRACFNGVAGAGCTNANITLNSLPLSNVSPGPVYRLRPQLQQAPGLPPCTQFNFNGGPTAVNVVAPCNDYTLPAGGNQGRSAAVTGIKANSMNDAFNVSPNPVSDKLVINYASGTGKDVAIGLYNNLGQLVTPMITPKTLQGSNAVELDLNALNINSGIYFITIHMDGATTTKKIIYTK